MVPEGCCRMGWRSRGACGHTRKGGLYHDGRFATLKDVLEHYNRQFKLGRNEQEKGELILTHLPGIAPAVIRTPTENRQS